MVGRSNSKILFIAFHAINHFCYITEWNTYRAAHNAVSTYKFQSDNINKIKINLLENSSRLLSKHLWGQNK